MAMLELLCIDNGEKVRSSFSLSANANRIAKLRAMMAKNDRETVLQPDGGYVNINVIPA
jgi:hypothetical protein